MNTGDEPDDSDPDCDHLPQELPPHLAGQEPFLEELFGEPVEYEIIGPDGHVSKVIGDTLHPRFGEVVDAGEDDPAKP